MEDEPDMGISVDEQAEARSAHQAFDRAVRRRSSLGRLRSVPHVVADGLTDA